MSILSFIYDLIIGPIIMLFDTIFSLFYTATIRVGASIIALSIVVNLLVLPLYRRADAMQEEERVRLEKLKPGIDHIKKVFKGDERFMMLQTYYRQNHYKPYYSLKGSLSLLLEIPFFIAAYNFLSHLYLLNGTPFKNIPDLGKPDGLLSIGGLTVNLLPILMTVINIVSGMIYTKGAPLKSKIQLYGMALIFLVLLYDSPSGLVFYWTLNNLFSLGKNIYYKLKNPMRTLGIFCFTAGCGLMLYVFIKPMLTPKKQIFVILCILPLFFVLPLHLLRKKYKGKLLKLSTQRETNGSENGLFTLCCIFLTILTGLLIPSAVISASPGEFVNRAAFHTPLRYVVTSFAYAAGTFLIWVNIFYRLSSQSVRRKFASCMAILSGWGAVNYMFFGRNYGNMSSLLRFDVSPESSVSSHLINIAVLLTVGAAIILVRRKAALVIRSIALAMTAAVMIMSCINIFSVNSAVKKISASLDSFATNGGIEIPLDKKGKNVIVIMLDRAVCEFFPYIIEEKPELKEQLAGFTYYPNTISYGNITILASPALFGGYEYTPENMNNRISETLKDKQTESLKLMPVLFSENGYEVTVCDPPFAGFSYYPDLSIYNDNPEIKRYIARDKFVDNISPALTDELRNHNLFAYSLMRISPLLLHQEIYDKGLYHHSAQSSVQVVYGMYNATGGTTGADSFFVGAYNVLKKLSDLTRITDNGQNTFFMMGNDSTHDVIMLKEPEYEPAEFIDNREYETAHAVRKSADGGELRFGTVKQIKHYQCNVAALLRLGEWMDSLREKGVYDNTRIIIVADHGKDLDNIFNGGIITNGSENIPETDNGIMLDDTMAYKPLFLVKDFGSTELTTDNTFMTNADTPTLAFKGLIKDPVNPFTGNEINSEAKNEKEHHIAGAPTSNPDKYAAGATQFEDFTWIGFTGNDTTDISAWRGIGKNLN